MKNLETEPNLTCRLRAEAEVPAKHGRGAPLLHRLGPFFCLQQCQPPLPRFGLCPHVNPVTSCIPEPFKYVLHSYVCQVIGRFRVKVDPLQPVSC